jgi:uncharacterized damage-inducible protein DinB
LDIRTPEDFSAAWHLQTARTLRLLQFFDLPDLDLTPGPGAMSLSGQVAHIVAASEFTADLLLLEKPGLDGFARIPRIDSPTTASREIARSSRAVCEAAASLQEERWNAHCDVFGPPHDGPRRSIAFLMLDHFIHHLGALHVYARIAGKVPPKLYHTVDPTVFCGLE